MYTQCACNKPGWCERYQRKLVGNLFDLCHRMDDLGESYRQYFLKKADELRPPPVTLWQKIKNFLWALAKHVANHLEKVCKEEYDKRIETCNKCELLKSDDRTCRMCGCYIDIKAWWKSEDCPMERWPKISLPIVQGGTSPPVSLSLSAKSVLTPRVATNSSRGCGCGKQS